MTRTIGNQSGFTLVEILMSIGLMAIIMAGMTLATITSLRMNAYSRDATAAAALLQDVMEQLRSLNPNMVGGAGNNTASDTCDATCDPSAPVKKFTRTFTFTQETPYPGLAQIEVTVEWPVPPNNTLRSISAVAYLCNASDCV